MNRLRALVTLCAAAAGGFAGVVACSDMAESAYGDPTSNPNEKSDANGGLGGNQDGVGQTSGVVLVHAAAFPAFRLCFEKLPDLAPQPDSHVMPQANVVGVEVGSVVRIDPISAPGKVYVISEKALRTAQGSGTPLRCGKLICQGSSACLQKNTQYLETEAINEALGQDRVHILAITGCGNEAFLDQIKISSTECENWSSLTGSLKAHTIPLLPSNPTSGALPVQLIHMSTPLEARRKNKGDVLEVEFGAIADAGPDAAKDQTIASGPTIFTPDQVVNLTVNQSAESVFGTHGFRVALRGANGITDAGDAGDASKPKGPASFEFSQSLAEVQELSSPDTIPTAYYSAASNYALLLLGDPRFDRILDDGGPNASFDRQRGVHLIAIPVKEPKDGGTDGGGGTDLPPADGGSGN